METTMKEAINIDKADTAVTFTEDMPIDPVHLSWIL